MTSDGSQIWFVFNELSARIPAATIHQGHRRMDDMVSAVATMMTGRPAAFVVVGEANLWAAELASGYTVTNWLSKTDRDRRSLLLRIASKHDFPEEVDKALRDRFYSSEFVISQEAHGESGNRVEAKGLGTAYLLAGTGVSLRSEGRWCRIRIPLQHTWLDEDSQEQSEEVEALKPVQVFPS